MTQYVRVEVAEGRAYTYTWDQTPPLVAGEQVVLPSNMVQDREFSGRVIRVLDGPDTDFPLKAVVRRDVPESDLDLL
jgi:hypothetical protein